MDYFIVLLLVYVVNPKASIVLLITLVSMWIYAKLTD